MCRNFICVEHTQYRLVYWLKRKRQDPGLIDKIDNLIIEHLGAIRSEVGEFCNDVADMKLRISSLEDHVARMRRDLVLLHSDIAVILVVH